MVESMCVCASPLLIFTVFNNKYELPHHSSSLFINEADANLCKKAISKEELSSHNL